MRILLIAPPNPDVSRLDKAFRESMHGVERVDEWRDGCFAATQDRFDAIVVVATNGAAAPAILDGLPLLAASAGSAPIAAIVAGATSAQRA
jgi:two-component system, OmpR family, response regulator